MKRAILVSDASRASLFASTGRNEPLRLLHSEDNPLGRARDRDLVTDEPGRYSEGGKHGIGSAMEPPTRAHEVEEERFARHLAQVLKQSHARGEFESVLIASPAHMLGLLRADLGPAVERVAIFLAKDFARLAPAELMEHVGPVLWPGS
jgi:protein required for attachment to host cells